jgi:Fe-S cluster assembly protein SufD
MADLISSDYLAGLLEGRVWLPEARSDWLRRLRARAVERANALSVPTTRDEEWRFTDLAPMLRVAFKPPRPAASISAEDIAAFAVPEAGARLVFCDGHWMRELSSVDGLPSGLTVCNLGNAPDSLTDAMTSTMGRLAAFDRDPFSALNTVFLHEGAVIHASAHAVLAAPIHLLFITTQKESIVHPRILVMADEGAQVSFIEDYVRIGDEAALVNAITEVEIAPGARVSQIKLQRLSDNQFHIHTVSASVGRDAHFASRTITFGARVSRHNLQVRQVGENAECQIDGLAFIAGRQLADTHSTMDHAVSHGHSRQMHKCIADGAARAVFSGKIMVRAGAQRTDSSQHSRNLLLSDRAHVDTKPQLEIFADDVKCAHGATVGQLDADELFYLQSRGITLADARSLLSYAFAAELIEQIAIPSLTRRLEEHVLAGTRKAPI